MTWEPTATGRMRFAVVGDFVVWWSWEPSDDVHWVDFAVYYGDEYEPDADNQRIGGFAERTPEVYGFTKWDGCTQWNTGGFAHTDGDEQFANLLEALRVAYQIAGDEILTAE